MSRFTDPNKWHKDKWFRKLKPLQKLIFLYLIDNCDIAGFWEKDFGMMAYSIGVSEEEIEGAYKGLSRGLLEADGWIWVKNFIKHQKNLPLNPKNNAHKGIIRILKTQEKRFAKCSEFTEFLIEEGIKDYQETPEKVGANEGLNSPTGKGKGKGKGNIDKEDKNFSDDSQVDIPEINEFKDYGDQIAVVPAYCEHVYNSTLSRGWRDGRGNTIEDWRAYLRMKSKYQHSWIDEQQEHSPKPKPKAQVVN